MIDTTFNEVSEPWYRHRWPWLLMSGPAIVVVAGFITLGLALKSNDGVVADDYYRQGLGINKDLQRDHLAQQLGYGGLLTLDQANKKLSLTDIRLPPNLNTLHLKLAHATRSRLDLTVVLQRNATGTFSAAQPALAEGKWYVHLSDPGNTWRLQGEWIMQSGNASPLQLGVARTGS